MNPPDENEWVDESTQADGVSLRELEDLFGNDSALPDDFEVPVPENMAGD